jgi:hypothetical protein
VPTQPYYNRRGERRPGTTYVIGQNSGWNKDALMGWANREGLAGRKIRDDKQTGGTTVERAADIGTAAHTMIEAFTLGQEPKLVAAEQLTALKNDEDRAKAKQGFANFQRWFRNSRIRIVATEIFGVDEEYQTGYCADALGLEENENGEAAELTLLDWKTSKGTYSDHAIQVAAYTVFIEKRLSEWMGHPVRLTGAHVVRVAKDTGNFKHAFWSRDSLEICWNAFTWLRALHEVRWPIEAMVR